MRSDNVTTDTVLVGCSALGPGTQEVARSAYRYVWDEVGRLLFVDCWDHYMPATAGVSGDYHAGYNYDATNRRTVKQETTEGATTAALYVFDTLEHRGVAYDGAARSARQTK